MAKRKKANPTTEPRKNPELSPHCHPTTTTSTPEHNRRPPPPLDPTPSTTAGSGSDSDPTPPSSPGFVRHLIEPYSKPRLVSILAESAASDPALRARLAAAADASLSHRRLFVHGLPPRASSSALSNAFSRFGPISDSHAVAAGGRCRGYGFVTFASRSAARRALRDAPRVVTFAGQPVSTQFVSAGPTAGGSGGAGRRVYVTNVAPDAGADRLRAFFAGFGELEGGPFGFDGETGRSRGYALFVYRAAAGAAAAVAEPYRVFEGRTLRCQLADEPPKRKVKAPAAAPAPAVVVEAPGAGTPPPPSLQPVLDAIAASGVGELATCARDPAQAAALLGKNPALAAAALSSALASAAAAARGSAVVAVAPSQAAASAPMPANAVAVAPLPVKFGVRPSGGAGLLGPYKPP
ncbi:unnamed protein product [Urochloa decumbens]|uniref:RRM domain-containing protein n=1 Tax=Urochloa decumbens TaxID=240449 RepID=A0ABC9APL3_9POAL